MQLPERVEALVAHIAAHTLNSLDFIEHNQQPGLSGVAENGENPLQEVQRPEVIDLPFDAGISLRARGHIRLTRKPGQDAVGDRPGHPRLGLGDSPAGRH